MCGRDFFVMYLDIYLLFVKAANEHDQNYSIEFINIITKILGLSYYLQRYTLHQLQATKISVKQTLKLWVADLFCQLVMIFWPLLFLVHPILNIIKNEKNLMTEASNPKASYKDITANFPDIESHQLLLSVLIVLSISFGILILWFFFFKCCDLKEDIFFTELIANLEPVRCINNTHFLFPKFKGIQSANQLKQYRKLYSVLVCMFSLLTVAVPSVYFILTTDPKPLDCEKLQQRIFRTGPDLLTHDELLQKINCTDPDSLDCERKYKEIHQEFYCEELKWKYNILYMLNVTFLFLGTISFFLSLTEYLCIRIFDKMIFRWAFSREFVVNNSSEIIDETNLELQNSSSMQATSASNDQENTAIQQEEFDTDKKVNITEKQRYSKL